MPDPVRLSAGSVAPDFSLPDADGAQRTLADLRGDAGLVLFCYPAAGTPGCTTEAVDFRDRALSLVDLGYALAGLSPDPVAKLAKFRDAQGLPFPLLSDPAHAVLAAYGAWGEKVLYGRRSVGVIRSTFVVAPDGRLSAAFYGVKAKGHAERVLRELAGS